MSGRCDEQDDLTLVYLWARKEVADEIERLREAVHEIMAVPNSEAAPGIMRVIAKHALGEDK